MCPSSFFFTDPSPTEIYTLSLHDALPICLVVCGEELLRVVDLVHVLPPAAVRRFHEDRELEEIEHLDRKSTRLNSSYTVISYAVFCLKKKKKKHQQHINHKKDITNEIRTL